MEGGQTARFKLVAGPRTALVLSGGGARGAYEVGVVRWLREELPALLGRQPRFDYLTGTSVGAINSSFLAATLQRAPEQGKMLARLWESLRLGNVWRFHPLRAMRLLLGRVPPPTDRLGGLVDAGPVEEVVRGGTPWPWIRRNLRQRRFYGLSLSATDVATGRPVNFLQFAPGEQVPREAWGNYATPIETEIRAEHVLASAALPVLFPSVKVGERFYADGGLRQNTPLAPAIRMGAERILAVSVRHKDPTQVSLEDKVEVDSSWGSPVFLAGKLLDALLLDPLIYDVHRIRQSNKLIEAGQEVFGADFQERLNRRLAPLRGFPLRKIELFLIGPSVDLGEIAARAVKHAKKGGDRWNRWIVERMARMDDRRESDLTSYLLFDGSYARELIELGFQDAKARAEEIAQFFSFQAQRERV